MVNFVSIDPGKNACGVAVWIDYYLSWAGWIKNPLLKDPGKERAARWGDMAYMVNTVCVSKIHTQPYSLILEIPQVYDGFSDEDKNDLIDLAGVQGAIVGVSNVEVEWSPLPREWKGQLPKEISERRVDSKLSQDEKDRISWPAKSYRHNVYDAIHLGIVHLERKGLRDFTK
jgi:hypothetical protein